MPIWDNIQVISKGREMAKKITNLVNVIYGWLPAEILIKKAPRQTGVGGWSIKCLYQ